MLQILQRHALVTYLSPATEVREGFTILHGKTSSRFRRQPVGVPSSCAKELHVTDENSFQDLLTACSIKCVTQYTAGTLVQYCSKQVTVFAHTVYLHPASQMLAAEITLRTSKSPTARRGLWISLLRLMQSSLSRKPQSCTRAKFQLYITSEVAE